MSAKDRQGVVVSETEMLHQGLPAGQSFDLRVLLEESLSHLGQGVMLYDRDLRLVTCNSLVQDLLELPDHLVLPGALFEDLARFNAERNEYGPDSSDNVEDIVQERKQRLYGPAHYRRRRPNGTVLDIRRTELPEGGQIFTYTDVTDNVKYEETLEQKNRLTQLLYSVPIGTTRAETVKEALQACLQEIADYTGWPVGHVFITDPEKEGQLISADIWHFENPEAFPDFKSVSEDAVFEEGIGLPGRVMESRLPVWIIDVTKDHNFPRARFSKDLGIRSGLAFPIIVDDKIYGVIEFFTRDAIQPDFELLDVLSHIGNQLGQVIERTRAEEGMRKLSRAIEQSPVSVVITNRQGNIEYVNPRFTRSTGYLPHEVIGKNPRLLKSGHTSDDEYKKLWETIASGKEWHGELKNLRKDKTSFWEAATISPLRNKDGEITHFIAVKEDITQRKEAEEHIRKLAHYDSLTELPNRASFQERLAHALALSRRHKRRGALLFIDLNDFKDVNDTLGHLAGDTLLHMMAGRLNDTARGCDLLARIGGDEFAAIIYDINSPDEAAALADRIIKVAREPFSIEGNTVHVGASVGIAVFPDDGLKPKQLIRNADLALYRAKEDPKADCHFFVAEMDEEVLERKRLAVDLRKAIDNNELELYYQPLINIETGAVTAVEALLRWNHGDRGQIPPGNFIHIAEETRMIVPIGEWVINEACRQNKAWQDQGLNQIPVAVNMSLVQFRHQNAAEIVGKALSHSGLDAKYLHVEITESVAMADSGDVQRALKEIREMGVHISLDDFGTGYSSLSHLRKLPVDKLKIDRSFLHDLSSEGGDSAIIEAILNLGKSLGKAVTAEGVELPTQVTTLRNLGCGEIQGFLYSHPIRAADCAELLDKALQPKKTDESVG